MKKIALFGGTGYLGSQLAAYYKLRGVPCDIFDMPVFDVTDSICWNRFRPEEYSSVLFFAGMTGTDRSFTDANKFLAVNEQGLLNLLSRLSPLGEKAPKVIFPSSRLVYKGDDNPLKEDAPKEAKTVYAANKLACECFLQAYNVRYGIRYCVVRICVPYGNIAAADYSYGTIGFFLKQAESDGSITLYGDGALRRTFTHVEDICTAVSRLADDGPTGVYNIGGFDYSLIDVARMIARKKEVDVSFVPWPAEALMLESGSTCFDATKISNAIGSIEYKNISSLIENI